MSKRESVLLSISQASEVIDGDYYKKFFTIVNSEKKWYIPSHYNNYFCIAYEPEFQHISPSIYEDDGSGLWSKGVKYFKIGQICIAKAEFDRFRMQLTIGIDDDTEVDDYYIDDCLSSYHYEERGSPYDYWTNRGTNKERKDLLNCRTIKQLYAGVCDYVGTDGEELFASYGFTISEFIEEILQDQNCLINE